MERLLPRYVVDQLLAKDPLTSLILLKDGLVGRLGHLSIPEVAAFLVVLFLVGAITISIRTTALSLAGERVVTRVRKDLFSNVVKQDIAFFDLTGTGELTNRLASDTVSSFAPFVVGSLLTQGTLAVGHAERCDSKRRHRRRTCH